MRDLGAFGRRAAEHRVLHDELAAVLGPPPHRLVENAVEHDPLVVAQPLGGHRTSAGVHHLQLRRRLRRGVTADQHGQCRRDPPHHSLPVHRRLG
jgi:hypothetical protein